MHTTVMQFIVDLFEAGVDAHEGCFNCYHIYRPIFPDTKYYERVSGHLAVEKKLAIVRAMEKAGFSIEEMRQLLEINPAGSPDGSTDAEIQAGIWYPRRCTNVNRLVEAVKNRYPDAS